MSHMESWRHRLQRDWNLFRNDVNAHVEQKFRNLQVHLVLAIRVQAH